MLYTGFSERERVSLCLMNDGILLHFASPFLHSEDDSLSVSISLLSDGIAFPYNGIKSDFTIYFMLPYGASAICFLF